MNNRWPGASLALGCLLLVALRCEAQNLVPNPSFELLEEDCDSLQCCFNAGSRPFSWYTWQNSSDYFNACAEGEWLDSLVDVPQNGWAFQYAHDGQAYAGVCAYQGWDDYREYIGTELNQPMVAGTSYSVSFWISLGMGGNYWYPEGACNNMGVLFTTQSNAWLGITGPEFGFRNYAHVYTSAIVTDTLNWTLVSGTFTADSAYQYIVLGNFFDSTYTDAIDLVPPLDQVAAYYLIDDVCVSTGGEGCDQLAVEEAGPTDPTWLWDQGSGQLVIGWKGAGSVQADVVDMAGRRVKAAVGAGQDGLVMDLRDLSPGSYVVRALAGEASGSFKFVVLR